ncbi:hypothetical protein HPB50_004451 [Hyalomma asiaticum]|uniref:Uncharacterized protein n=1 Tax=Hyalomma asiaticum TaxID=266040 RepID=A0ACB7TF48_HYAAI|nr:hypothetical protein HPB50_004451 [Hyalomma asiaticum]
MRPSFTLDVVGKCVRVSGVDISPVCVAAVFRSATSASRSCGSVVRPCALLQPRCLRRRSEPSSPARSERWRGIRKRASSFGNTASAPPSPLLREARAKEACVVPFNGCLLWARAALAQEWPLAGLMTRSGTLLWGGCICIRKGA